ncbi:hypothetical protein JNUCC0626_00575 [Lentzea sp. JNUCC 0626]|uniref:hypothetical protein n=1 Tax=Lentzea sp. JNUCC 0626 TaxID=3367513 RepID=UPI003747BBD4
MFLVHGEEIAADAPVLRTGGVPLVPAGFTWPLCRECGEAMQFLAHLPLDFGTVAVFMCQDDPGMCDCWDAVSGANRACLFTGPLSAAVVPAEGETLLGAVTALRPHSDDEPAEESVLGKLGGEPEWWQNDETPVCPSCTTPMTFTAQLEEGHDHTTAINFGGGGRGYVFHCQACEEAAFVWQR